MASAQITGWFAHCQVPPISPIRNPARFAGNDDFDRLVVAIPALRRRARSPPFVQTLGVTPR
jgi:hypothetical protein